MGAKNVKYQTSILNEISNDVGTGNEDDMIDMQTKIGSFNELKKKVSLHC